MRILFLTHAFNSLAQRLFVELEQRGHEVSIEFDIRDSVAIEAVEAFKPNLIIAPFLKRRIPDQIWRNHLCIIVHPGIKGDRGASSLDWAISRGDAVWGVTCLQADAEMDAGDIWASCQFPMRDASKSSIYRNEVSEAALSGVLEVIENHQAENFVAQPLAPDAAELSGQWHPYMRQEDRSVDWTIDSTEEILRKIRAGDGVPGVLDASLGRSFYLHDACFEERLRGERPGEIIAQREGAICRATIDGAVWIGSLRLKPEAEDKPTLKLPATQLLEGLNEVHESLLDNDYEAGYSTWQPVRYRVSDQIGYLYFDFYNGAMSTAQCKRLQQAYRHLCSQDVRLVVLMGGADFWSNGIHLNQIEAAESAADESWNNINAMNDLTREIICTDDRLIVSALRGNAGAGGVFLSLAADLVWVRKSVVLNPHYKSMGNLYGSEYWTYLLPKRVGDSNSAKLTQKRLPIGGVEALELGLIDDCFGSASTAFESEVISRAKSLVASPDFDRRLREKREAREADESIKPLERYRDEEMRRMHLNFYGFDSSYHVARYHFVYKIPKARTPVYLARHRRL